MQKIGNLLCKLAIYCVNFGVNFILQKFCLCKKNDKYEVWIYFQRPLIRKRDICTSLGGWVNVTEPPGPQRASLLLRIKASNGSGCLKRPQSHTAHCYAITNLIQNSNFRVQGIFFQMSLTVISLNRRHCCQRRRIYKESSWMHSGWVRGSRSLP